MKGKTMATEVSDIIGKKITTWKPWNNEMVIHSVDVTGDCPVNPKEHTLRIDYAKTSKGMLFNFKMWSGLSNSSTEYFDLVEEVDKVTETLWWIAEEYHLTLEEMMAMVRRNVPTVA